MFETNCRIGKVKFKHGGEVHLLPPVILPYCHTSAVNMLNQIDENTLAVGFFIVREDRSVCVGYSYDRGSAPVDLTGAAEMLKNDILCDKILNGIM